ncbi:hypothetical protein NQ317_006244 [Molorchus minor]|uniref:Uncharacterized protein n=1 Tax=Molorchus minor TaxID=1323400 RepID=A0ABQ9K5I5_9CUCU|nr:hypothetical protein NQ317_006244 [Molorchus minor]
MKWTLVTTFSPDVALFFVSYSSIFKQGSNFAEYVRKYATEEALRGQENVSSDSESSMSDFSENEAEDMEL